MDNNINEVDFWISDLTGRVVLKKDHIDGVRFAVDTGSLPPGIYAASLYDGASMAHLKLIIR